MAAERVAVGVRRGAVLERLEEPVAGDHRADRRVARGHALGAGDDVGLVAELGGAEHLPHPPEGADDLVGDQQDVVLVADLADPLEVAGRGREAAAGVLHRLEEDRGDGVGALELDRLGDPVRGPAAEGLLVVAEVVGAAVEVGVGHLVGAGDQRLEHLLQRRDAGDGQRALRGAVVGHGPGDDLVLVGLAGELEVLLGELPRRLDGLAAAGGEEDAVEVAGRHLRRSGRRARRPAGARRTRAGRRPAPWPAWRPPRRAPRGRGRPGRRTGRRGRRCTRGRGCPRSCGPRP